jgi:N-dimethylarginine dimethylaminohydrolase
LVLKHARDAFVDQAGIDGQWSALNFTGRPDLTRAIEEYECFCRFFEELGAELEFLPRDHRTGLDSVYVRDASVVCSKGIIFCNMGKAQRSAEPEAARNAFEAEGLPICGTIRSPGLLEGGDVVWLDNRTLAVGQGYRTNAEGIRQLTALLGDCADEVLTVPLPHWQGPADVFHLMSILSPLDNDLALVYSPLMPVTFREELLARRIELIEVDDNEFESMAGNVLAVAPRRCLMLTGNPVTQQRLEKAGVEVHLYRGEEISRKGCGGPTCLTRPILRAE